jgi:hypothetical protein
LLEEKLPLEEKMAPDFLLKAREECIVQLYGQEILDKLLKGQLVEIDQEAKRTCVQERILP